MKDIQAGDIIAIEEPAYVEFEGGLYSDHFVMKKALLYGYRITKKQR